MAILNVIFAERRSDGLFKVVADVDGILHSFRVSGSSDLDRQVLALAESRTKTADITLGSREVIKAEPVVVVSTQAELDRAQFFRDYARLQRLQQFVDCGVILPTNTTYTAKKDKVRSELKAEYLA